MVVYFQLNRSKQLKRKNYMETEKINPLARALLRLRQSGVSEDVMNELEQSMGSIFGSCFDGITAISICERMLPLIRELSCEWDAAMFGECGSQTLTEINAISRELQALLRVNLVSNIASFYDQKEIVRVSNHRIEVCHKICD